MHALQVGSGSIARAALQQLEQLKVVENTVTYAAAISPVTLPFQKTPKHSEVGRMRQCPIIMFTLLFSLLRLSKLEAF